MSSIIGMGNLMGFVILFTSTKSTQNRYESPGPGLGTITIPDYQSVKIGFIMPAFYIF